MKKGRISVVACIFITLTILCSVSYGQVRVNWEEFPALAKTITYDVPEGKALLVFEGREDYRFISDNENIDQPVKDGLLYKLLVSIEPPSGGINISSPGVENFPLNYGRPNEYSLPALNNKEIRYFKLSIVKQLISSDKTRELQKINADVPSEGDDALVIIFPNPPNLDLQFDGPITSNKHENDRYRIYMKTGNQKLTVKSKNYFKTIIDLDSLKKEVRFFRVQTPISNDDNITEDPNVKVGSYAIETTPPRAVIQMVGNPPFNEKNFTTPYTINGFKTGPEIITLTLDRYEIVNDTILISSSKGKKSKYKLIPKFAFLNCNIEPAIPTSKVLFDNNELTYIIQGKDYECPKGTHNIEFSAPHYYPQTKQVSLAAGATNELNINLKPKMGLLSILSGMNASGAEVTINGKKVGNIPVEKLALQEGTYIVSFTKSGFMSEMSSYSVEVLENKLTDFKEFKMINAKNVAITTSPAMGATVYIDGNLLSDKSNLHVKLGIGKHTIKIEREHYESLVREFTVDQQNDAFNFNLEESAYQVSITTKPSGSKVYVDGADKGISSLSIDMPLGSHSLMFKKSGYLTKKKIISVNKPMTVYTKLFPSSYRILGADYGVGQYGLNVGITRNRLLLMVGIHKNLNPYKINQTDVVIENVTAYDIGQNVKESGRIYSADSVNYPLNFKLGYTIKKPFIFVVTAGCAIIQTDKFQKAYKAEHDYLAGNSGPIIHSGDLFSEPYLTKHAYTAITGGLFVPIAQTMYLSVDYYSDSDIGPGFSFGLGFIIH